MAAKPPYLALIANNLQRFDIADHRLLGDAMFNLSQEQLKDLISDDGYGRVFSGFTPTWTAGTNTLDFTVGVAVNSDGELMVRDTAASRTITPVNGKVYGVYAVIEEIVDTALVSRRKWNGTVEVVDNSVPVKTFKKVSLGEVSDTFSSSFSVGSLFPEQVSSKTILPLAAVTVNGSGVKTFYDCRRMWAVDGNVQPSIGLPSELPHDFAEEVVDPPTLGITGVRSFFRALADRVQAVTGEDLWWSNPPITLNALWAMLGTTGTGVKRVRTVTDTAALTALVGAVDKDVVYSQAQNSLYQYSASSTATVAGIRVVSGNGGTGRWFIHNRGATDVAYGYPGLGSDGALSKTDVVKTSNVQNLAITNDKLADSAINNSKLADSVKRKNILLKFEYVENSTVNVTVQSAYGVTDVALQQVTQSINVDPSNPGSPTITNLIGVKVSYSSVVAASGVSPRSIVGGGVSWMTKTGQKWAAALSANDGTAYDYIGQFKGVDNNFDLEFFVSTPSFVTVNIGTGGDDYYAYRSVAFPSHKNTVGYVLFELLCI